MDRHEIISRADTIYSNIKDAADMLGLSTIRVHSINDGFGGKYTEGVSILLPMAKIGKREIGGLVAAIAVTAESYEYNSYVTVDIMDPYFGTRNSDNIHPHIDLDTGLFCFPAAPIIEQVATGQYLAALVAIIGVINTHTENGHYQSIPGEFECNSCGEPVPDRDGYNYMYDCSRCGEDTCGNCYSHCNICEEKFCGSCSEYLEYEDVYNAEPEYENRRSRAWRVCDEHNVENLKRCWCCDRPCNEDNEAICKCGKYFISGHSPKCIICDETFCAECGSGYSSNVCIECVYKGEDAVQCTARIVPHPDIPFDPELMYIDKDRGEVWCKACRNSSKADMIELFRDAGLDLVLNGTFSEIKRRVVQQLEKETTVEHVGYNNDNRTTAMVEFIISQHGDS